jgi:hypothetical protein
MTKKGPANAMLCPESRERTETMRALKRIFIAATLLIALGAAYPNRIAAQSPPAPEAMKAADELFSLMSKDMVGQIASQLTAALWPLIETDLKTKLDAATIAQLRVEFERIQMDNMAMVMKGAPAIYARHFTVQELHDLTAFYRTPTGQKAVREMPQVMEESIEAITPRIQEIQTQSMEAFSKVLRERGYIK